MNCLTSMVKYILYVFNIIFLICGLLLIILGSIMLVDMNDFSSYNAASNSVTLPILITVLGAIIFIISFFGCFGAIRENVCCTNLYAVSMFILFCLQIALTVWVLVSKDDFLKTMSNIVTEAFNEQNGSNVTPMDTLQMSFKCCGINNYTDYTNNQRDVPSSCCGTLNGSCSASVYESRPGCNYEFVEFWRSNMNIIGYAGIGVALIELVALTFACCLANNFRKGQFN